MIVPSYCLQTQTVWFMKLKQDFYADITSHIDDLFDTSEYPKDHPAVQVGFKTGMNKKLLGKFKDEMNGKQIEEFVGLRAKLYSYRVWSPNKEHSDEHKKCKGIKNVVSKRITHDDYKKCFFSGDQQIRTMNIIRSRKREIYTEEINKIALSGNDDKRIICNDKINTYAIGHMLLDPLACELQLSPL